MNTAAIGRQLERKDTPVRVRDYGTGLLIEGVHKGFGTHHVLRGIDLRIAPGEFVAIVGRSGCGKSTLLRLAAGLDTPSSGTVAVDGQVVSGLNPAVRVMFQDARLLPWRRTLENVALGLGHEWRPRAEEMLSKVGLAGRARDWPAVLSGGQRQRVALARALASRPRLLLLDEPLGSLDALTRIEMQELVEELWEDQGFTALLVTHDVEEAVVLADRVVVIVEGRIALDVAVPLPRPRPRGTAAVAAIVGSILETILGRPHERPLARRSTAS